MSKTFLLTGGGTGGHVYPALAVAQAVRDADPDTQFVYCGIRGGIEERIAQQNDIPFVSVLSAPFPGKKPVQLIKFAARVAIGTLQAAWQLLKRKPQTLVATGGYVSAPAVFAAVALRALRLLRIDIFVHEQNMSPGRLNRLVARFADVVGVSFHGSVDYLPGAPARYVGYPIRPALRDALTSGGTSDVLDGIPEGRRVVLVFGGSQGARTVNRAVVDALPHLQHTQDLFIIHGIGRRQRSGYDPEADVKERLSGLTLERPLDEFYRAVNYIDDIGVVYQRSCLVICRGGAGTVKEVCAVGRPAIVLPKAGLSGDHQVMNALVLEQAGAARVLLEEPTVPGTGPLLPAVPGERLADAVKELLADPAQLKDMAARALALDDPDAMSRILAALNTRSPVAVLEAERPAVLSERVEIQLAEMGPDQLLGHVRRVRPQYTDHLSDMPGFAYLQYRAAAMMTAAPWRIRNIGIKLCGLLRLEPLIPLLRHIAEDPTPASRFARMVGGERAQNGFIRRNLVTSLVQIGAINDHVAAVVAAGCNDTYWEVRREAVHAIGVLNSPLSTSDWARAAVVRGLVDRSFEVRIAGIRAIGRTWGLQEGLPHLRPFYMDANWQIREAVLRAFAHWAEDGTDADKTVLRAEFDEVLLTAGGYRPLFGLKETAKRVSQGLQP